MWRLSIADLHPCAIPTQGCHNHQCHEPKLEPVPTHINILEFFGIFIVLLILIQAMHTNFLANPAFATPIGLQYPNSYTRIGLV